MHNNIKSAGIDGETVFINVWSLKCKGKERYEYHSLMSPSNLGHHLCQLHPIAWLQIPPYRTSQKRGRAVAVVHHVLPKEELWTDGLHRKGRPVHGKVHTRETIMSEMERAWICCAASYNFTLRMAYLHLSTKICAKGLVAFTMTSRAHQLLFMFIAAGACFLIMLIMASFRSSSWSSISFVISFYIFLKGVSFQPIVFIGHFRFVMAASERRRNRMVHGALWGSCHFYL